MGGGFGGGGEGQDEALEKEKEKGEREGGVTLWGGGHQGVQQLEDGSETEEVSVAGFVCDPIFGLCFGFSLLYFSILSDHHAVSTAWLASRFASC